MTRLYCIKLNFSSDIQHYSRPSITHKISVKMRAGLAYTPPPHSTQSLPLSLSLLALLEFPRTFVGNSIPGLYFQSWDSGIRGRQLLSIRLVSELRERSKTTRKSSNNKATNGRKSYNCALCRVSNLRGSVHG